MLSICSRSFSLIRCCVAITENREAHHGRSDGFGFAKNQLVRRDGHRFSVQIQTLRLLNLSCFIDVSADNRFLL